MHTTDTTLAELASTHPAAARVFLSHGLDFCCKGRRPLADACAEKGLDAAGVLAEIATAGAPEDLTRWSRSPIPELVHHIVSRYHAELRRDLPGLIAMAEKVEARHADKPTVPEGYRIDAIATDLKIPRQTLVLPNGDILVAEGKGGAEAPAMVGQ